MKSLSRKVMLSIFLSTVVLSALMLLAFNFFGTRIIISETESKNAYFLGNEVQKINQLFQNSERTVSLLSTLVVDGLDYERFKADPNYASSFINGQKQLIVNLTESDAQIMGVYVYFEPSVTQRVDFAWYTRDEQTGNLVENTSYSPIEEFTPDNENLLWYYGPLKAKGLYWTPLYVDSDLKKAMISCTYPLYDQGNMIGSVGVDISFDRFIETLSAMQVGETGFAAMIDEDGTIMSHPSLKQGESFITAEKDKFKILFEAMSSNGSGRFNYKENNVQHSVFYTRASNGKYFLMDMKNNEIYSQLNWFRIIMICIAVLGVLAVMLISYLLGRSIAKPIVNLSNAAEQLALGDIDIQLERTSNDEVGLLTDAFNRMVVNIKAHVHVLEKIAAGDLSAEVQIHSDKDIQGKKLQEMIDVVQALVKDVDGLAQAGIRGQLDVRADDKKHKGDFGKIVKGVNATLDAVILPIQEAALVLKDMARGDLTVRMTGVYQGDHAAIQDSLNQTLEALSKYVSEISHILNELSNGNLNISIESEYLGDFAQIKTALNDILRSFNKVLGEINNAVVQVAAGSKQVSAGSLALSQGAVAQAGNIEVLNHSVNRMAHQTKQNAHNANQADKFIQEMSFSVQDGHGRMQELLKSIQAIETSSNQISKINKMIEGIAFQTNLLALNAAVEAARAGQQGKGFAVVASEVRNLASRSSKAAKDSALMIESSLSCVREGSSHAQETANSLNQIVSGIEKAADLVGNIAKASNEQADEIAQINRGIDQVSSVIQINSATSEQSAAASEQLLGQAYGLKHMVSRFKLRRRY